ncbi:hypothetical protein BC835DRAFT_322712 [Cytidiella melzeri]|nr:hypothetical protein BC835DRAFT_322712 [Cytidiella melzeri]
MCYGENSAEHAVDYFNSQLHTLWSAAKKCFEKNDTKKWKPETPEQRYTFALYTYHAGQRRTGAQDSLQNYMFHAIFAKPSIHFICNHEAVLTLQIEEGHYKPDVSRGLYRTAQGAHSQELKKVEVAFRMPFHLSGIRGGTSKIGNGEHIINLLVLELSKAQLLSLTLSTQEPAKAALTSYLQGYLNFLHNAGHHILFCFPEFDDSNMQHLFDYSMAARTLAGTKEIYGIEIEKINNHLSTSWLKAAMISGPAEASSSNRASVSLAEWQSSWSSQNFGVNFHIMFGPPKVEALCGQEAVIYFILDDILFYDHDDIVPSVSKASSSFSDWKIAFLFNVSHEKLDDGNTTRCNLDLSSGRFMEQHSQFPEYDVSSDEKELLTHLLDFFTAEYFSLMESAEYHIIYHFDVRWPQLSGVFNLFDSNHTGLDEDVESGEWRVDGVGEDGKIRKRPKAAVWKDILETSDTCGLDVVTAVSQMAINSHFRTLWQSSSAEESRTAHEILRKWTHLDSVEAQFQRITIRLLSSGAAIVWIHIESGSLKTPQHRASSGDGRHAFSEWRLAFEVPLKKCRHEDVPGAAAAWADRFRSTPAYTHYGQSEGCTFHHIFLDLLDAQFLPELSNFNGLFTDLKRESIVRVKTLLSLVREHYFEQLMSAGYHVIQTVPVWLRGHEAPPYALTDFVFHVHSETEVTRQTLKSSVHVNEPVIVILGMVNGRSMPAMKFSSDWIARAGRLSQCGAICISKDLFFNERVLKLLSKVNAATTMIPYFTGVHGDDWGLDLVRWSDDVKRKDQGSRFTLSDIPGKEGVLLYSWKHHERWIYELLASNAQAKHSYTVSCLTENHLEIPTAFRHGSMELRVYGRVGLRIGFGDARTGPEQWTAESSVTWSSSLSVQSQAGGLSVSVNVKPPEYKRGTVSGTAVSPRMDPEQLLRKCFVETPNLREVADAFRPFEGMWKYSYPGDGAFNLAHPAFNQRGDLLFELRSYAPPGASPSTPRKPAYRNWNGAQTGGSYTRSPNGYHASSSVNDFVDSGITEEYTHVQNSHTQHFAGNARNGVPIVEVPPRSAYTPGSSGNVAGSGTTSHFQYSQRQTRIPTPTPGRVRTPFGPSPEMPQPQRAYTPHLRPGSAASGRFGGQPLPAEYQTSGFREMHNGSPFSTSFSKNEVHLNGEDPAHRRILRNHLREADPEEYDMQLSADQYGHPAAKDASFGTSLDGPALFRKSNERRWS